MNCILFYNTISISVFRNNRHLASNYFNNDHNKNICCLYSARHTKDTLIIIVYLWKLCTRTEIIFIIIIIYISISKIYTSWLYCDKIITCCELFWIKIYIYKEWKRQLPFIWHDSVTFALRNMSDHHFIVVKFHKWNE